MMDLNNKLQNIDVEKGNEENPVLSNNSLQEITSTDTEIIVNNNHNNITNNNYENTDNYINNIVGHNNNNNNNNNNNINNNNNKNTLCNDSSTQLYTTKNTIPTTTTSTTTTTTTATTEEVTQKSINDIQKQQQQSVVDSRLAYVTGNIILTAILICGIVLLWYYMAWYYGLPAVFVALIIILITTGGWHWLYIAAITSPRDVKALTRYIKLLMLIKGYQRKNVSIGDVFLSNVIKHPEKHCIIYDGKPWTFREVNEFANRIANLFQQHGFKAGDIIGLYMENRPEFICIWLGLSKIGVIIPLINSNLRQESLLHSITVANCNAVVFSESLESGITEVLKSVPSNLILYQFNDEPNRIQNSIIKDLGLLMTHSSKENIMNYNEKDKHHNKLLYIYTSGTTGMPKAAVITTARYVFIAAAIHYLADFKHKDIFYTPLPLYHTAAGIMTAGQAIIFGSTVVIRKKFSASNYFQDCQKYKCTIAQYIGEMCRYILATPPSSSDKAHSLRLIFGNGLRPQIWPQFIQRFNIPSVAEFYGATEGNANIVNVDNTVGAIGFISRIIPAVYPISIIRADPYTGEPIRGPDGLCQKCAPNEPGVFIGKIIPGNPSRAFLGYVDKKASSKKVVHNVFKKGDSAFLSGDIIVADVRGNLYFKDRTGDTFRWKGENVSTSEVEAQVSNVAAYRDTVVYGVEIPNSEGRAGMAAILDVDRTLNLTHLANELKNLLPNYARPQFIRLLNTVDLTGTFKLKKLDLQLEGFNPHTITDSLYYLSSKGQYEVLDKIIYLKICEGEIRF